MGHTVHLFSLSAYSSLVMLHRRKYRHCKGPVSPVQAQITALAVLLSWTKSWSCQYTEFGDSEEACNKSALHCIALRQQGGYKLVLADFIFQLVEVRLVCLELQFSLLSALLSG